jgi:hypothetical protein
VAPPVLRVVPRQLIMSAPALRESVVSNWRLFKLVIDSVFNPVVSFNFVFWFNFAAPEVRSRALILLGSRV